jgi:hypothetical protein
VVLLVAHLDGMLGREDAELLLTNPQVSPSSSLAEDIPATSGVTRRVVQPWHGSP